MTFADARLFGSQVDFVEGSVTGLQLQTAAHDQSWGLGRAAWAADLQTGTLTLTNDRFRATCPLQVIGTYTTQDGSWLWGWDHPSVPAPLAVHAGLVRDFAEQHRLDALLTRQLRCSETEIWAFVALANRLAEAQGAYRGPAGETLVMMTFGTVTLENP